VDKNPFKINLKWLTLYLLLAFIGWQLYKPKPAPPPRLTLQEEKNCDQLIVKGETFVDGELLIPLEVSGGKAYWEDGKEVREGIGRPILDGWPLRVCADNPNMVIKYYIMRPSE